LRAANIGQIIFYLAVEVANISFTTFNFRI
jgi:hypothetical protein